MNITTRETGSKFNDTKVEATARRGNGERIARYGETEAEAIGKVKAARWTDGTLVQVDSNGIIDGLIVDAEPTGPSMSPHTGAMVYGAAVVIVSMLLGAMVALSFVMPDSMSGKPVVHRVGAGY